MLKLTRRRDLAGSGRAQSPPLSTSRGAKRPARRGPRVDDTGSGTAIGVAILFPALMLVIVSISMLSESARADQALQSTATRAARTAALCCHYTGGPQGADAVVRARLTLGAISASANRVDCDNDLAGDSAIVFFDRAGNLVPVAANSPVPPGGSVRVFLTCRIPPDALGGFGFPGVVSERRVLGVASIDPYRSRSGG